MGTILGVICVGVVVVGVVALAYQAWDASNAESSGSAPKSRAAQIRILAEHEKRGAPPPAWFVDQQRQKAAAKAKDFDDVGQIYLSQSAEGEGRPALIKLQAEHLGREEVEALRTAMTIHWYDRDAGDDDDPLRLEVREAADRASSFAHQRNLPERDAEQTLAAAEDRTLALGYPQGIANGIAFIAMIARLAISVREDIGEDDFNLLYEPWRTAIG